MEIIGFEILDGEDNDLNERKLWSIQPPTWGDSNTKLVAR